MSSRISSLAANNQLVNILLNTQRRLQETDVQLSSGKVSQTYDGITLGSERMVNLENTQGALERFIRNNDTTTLQLDVMETAIEAMRVTIRDFKSLLGDLSASGTATKEQVKDIQDLSLRSLTNMEEYLNTQVNGQYLFAGGRNNTRPVNFGITTLAAFQSIYDGNTVNFPTTRDAHLADFSISKDTNNESGLFVDQTNHMIFRQDDGTQTSTINLGGTIDVADVIRATINGTNVTFTAATTSATDAAAGLAAAINANTTINGSVNATSTGGAVTITSETGATPFTLGASSWTTDTGANNTVADVTFAVTSSGVSTIESTSALFSNVKAGTKITVSGTSSNNGTYTVKSVSVDNTKIEIVTEMLTTETATAAQFELSDKTGATTQKDTVTALHGGTTTAGDTYTVTINGVNVTFTMTADETSNDLLAKAIADKINASTNAAVTPVKAVAATDGSGTIELTAKVPGVAFTLATSSVNATDGKISSVNNVLSGKGTAGTILTNTDTGTITFSRAGDTITAATDGVFIGVKVGEVITVSGTAENDGTYTVLSRDDNAKILTIDANKFTDEGVDTGDTFFDYAAGTQVILNNAASTIQVKTNGGAAALTGIFTGVPGLAVGDSITVAGAATGANNTTYSISAISSDGSTLTVSPAPNTTETVTEANDTAALKITGTGFSYTAATQLAFTNVGAAGTDTIQVKDAFGGAAVADVFANLRAGMKITVGGMPAINNNGTFTIKSISSDKSTITVEENITTTETDTDGATMKVFAADGTITASPYYSGDKVSLTQRIDKDREFSLDLNAVDPAFEKAIRAMSIIAQGVFATEGGLDQNKDRIQDSIFLLESSVSPTVSATPPFGTELSSNLEQVQMDLGFDMVLLNDTNEGHVKFITFLQSSIARTENSDPLETITRLLADARTLEASYEALSRIRELSLVNFLR